MGMAIGVTPPPAPASLSQATGEQGFTIATFTVTGTGFDAGGTSTLSFSGSGITVNSYGTRNATTLVANITIAPSAGLTARDVIVTNADTQTGTLAASFTITSGAPVPSAPVSPTSGAQGATITNFTVNGTNFVTPTLSFSGTGITVNSYSVQSSTQVVANITIGAAAATTARDVTVTNADTQTGTLSAAFTITSGGYNVTGNVGVGGATVSYSGTASGSVTADGSGNFTLTSLANGTYTIIPSLTGYAFQPGSLSVTVNGAAITGVNFALPYSVPDCRDYATFPNAAVNVNGTLMYTVLKTDSRAAGAPVDSRAAGAPAKCGTYLQNSRSHGVFGPNE